MLYVRYRQQENVRHGVIEGDRVHPLAGELFGRHEALPESVPLAEVTPLAPVTPGKILAAAVNYHSHAETGWAVLKREELPEIPQLFLKPASSIIAPGETIVLPEDARRVDAEGELVAVIGRTCRSVAPEEALGYVFGYTCGNDVSARHWQRDDVQWWRAKGSDTFSPLGPVIATGLDPAGLRLITRVNGAEVQSTSTNMLIFGVAEMVSFASRYMTLEPGDLLFTGTPGEPPRLNDGDVVEVEIGGIGVLGNPVKRASPGS